MRKSVFTITALVLVGACKKNPTTDLETESEKKYIPAIVEKVLPDGLTLEEVDLNSDGQADIFNRWRERSNAARLLVRKETDLNMDGRIDVRTDYDVATGILEMETMDGDFDGQMDMWDYYQDTDGDGDPERVKSEFDTDYDQRPNVFVYYRDGKITRKERDTNGDGAIDAWEKYDENGNVEKSGRDIGPDFDGSVDERWD